MVWNDCVMRIRRHHGDPPIGFHVDRPGLFAHTVWLTLWFNRFLDRWSGQVGWICASNSALKQVVFWRPTFGWATQPFVFFHLVTLWSQGVFFFLFFSFYRCVVVYLQLQMCAGIFRSFNAARWTGCCLWCTVSVLQWVDQKAQLLLQCLTCHCSLNCVLFFNYRFC
jgi:hypothetical protein